MRLGTFHTDETIEKMRAKVGLRRPNTTVTKMKKSYSHKYSEKPWNSYSHTPEQKYNETKHLYGNKYRLGKPHSAETIEKIRLGSIKSKTPESIRRNIINTIKGRRIKPTKPERRVIGIIQDWSLPFKYNGDHGDTIIGNKCPDFVCTDGTRCLIETFGSYFHEGIISENRPTEAELTEIYRSEGYKVLILWMMSYTSKPN